MISQGVGFSVDEIKFSWKPEKPDVISGDVSPAEDTLLRAITVGEEMAICANRMLLDMEANKQK